MNIYQFMCINTCLRAYTCVYVRVHTYIQAYGRKYAYNAHMRSELFSLYVGLFACNPDRNTPLAKPRVWRRTSAENAFSLSRSDELLFDEDHVQPRRCATDCCLPVYPIS